MCGLIYGHDFLGRPVNQLILQQFDDQRHRGTQGFGLFTAFKDGKTNIHKKVDEDGILKSLVKYDMNLVLFHHRNPTSTINVKRAAHPFSTGDFFGKTQYILAHNGHISNSRDLRKDHGEKFGIEYGSVLQNGTFNDSESLLWDLALVLEGKKKKLDASGGIAFICMKLVDGKIDKLFFGRNSNPLNMYRADKGMTLASEGVGEPIEPDTLYTWNYGLKRLTKKELTIPRYTAYATSYTGSNYTTTPSRGWGSRDSIDYTEPDWWKRDKEDTQQSLLPYQSEVYDDREDDELLIDMTDDEFEALIDSDEYAGPGSWIDRQYRKRFKKQIKKAHEPLGFQVKTPTHVYDKDRQLIVPRQTLREQVGDIISRPTKTQVDDRVLEYLIAAKGHFETAYWAVEADLDDLRDDMDDRAHPDEIAEMQLLEAVMEAIESDPENRDVTSVAKIGGINGS